MEHFNTIRRIQEECEETLDHDGSWAAFCIKVNALIELENKRRMLRYE